MFDVSNSRVLEVGMVAWEIRLGLDVGVVAWDMGSCTVSQSVCVGWLLWHAKSKLTN